MLSWVHHHHRTPPILAASCPHCHTNHSSPSSSQFITSPLNPRILFKIYINIYFLLYYTHICIYLSSKYIHFSFDKNGKEKENNWPQQDSSFSFGYVSSTPTPSLFFSFFFCFLYLNWFFLFSCLCYWSCLILVIYYGLTSRWSMYQFQVDVCGFKYLGTFWPSKNCFFKVSQTFSVGLFLKSCNLMLIGI